MIWKNKRERFYTLCFKYDLLIIHKNKINIALYLQTANHAASSKSKLAQRPTAEAASGWSNDIDGDDDSGYVFDCTE